MVWEIKFKEMLRVILQIIPQCLHHLPWMDELYLFREQNKLVR